MSNAKVVLANQPGPLPIKVEYVPECDIAETISFSGSIFTGDIAYGNVGFAVKVDGKTIGKSTIYTHDMGGTHHATIPTSVMYDIPVVFEDKKPKPVTIELVPLNYDSLSNKDDFYNLTIFI